MTTPVALSDLLPLIARQTQGWFGKFATADASTTQGQFHCLGIGDRGVVAAEELVDHWVYFPSTGSAYRVTDYNPTTSIVNVRAASSLTPQANEPLWVFKDSPHELLDALLQVLAENPTLYSMYRDFVMHVYHEDAEHVSDQAQDLTVLTSWDTETYTSGAWRKFPDRVELWLSGVESVVDINLGAAERGTGIEGLDDAAIDYLAVHGGWRFGELPRNLWSWNVDNQVLMLPEWCWQRVVRMTTRTPGVSPTQIINTTLANASDVSLGNPRQAGDYYPDGLTAARIATITDLAVAHWLANQLPSLHGERNLETKRLETSLRNRAQESWPIPDPIRK